MPRPNSRSGGSGRRGSSRNSERGNNFGSRDGGKRGGPPKKSSSRPFDSDDRRGPRREGSGFGGKRGNSGEDKKFTRPDRGEGRGGKSFGSRSRDEGQRDSGSFGKKTFSSSRKPRFDSAKSEGFEKKPRGRGDSQRDSGKFGKKDFDGTRKPRFDKSETGGFERKSGRSRDEGQRDGGKFGRKNFGSASRRPRADDKQSGDFEKRSRSREGDQREGGIGRKSFSGPRTRRSDEGQGGKPASKPFDKFVKKPRRTSGEGTDKSESARPLRDKRIFQDKKGKGSFDRKKGSDKSSKNQPDLQAPAQTEQIRLNRYIANSGVCSRREADELISMGLISVNGNTISELGYKVNPGDEVRYENRVLRAEKPVYILLNKPKGYLTTTDDPQERKTVMQLIGNVKERIYPVGRLDRNTTGLLLLTNDGDLADKLMHPSYNVKKIYKVELDRPLTKTDFQKVLDGVFLEEGRAVVDDLAIISDDAKTVGIELHIGWNRVVRRIFESLDYQVIKLDRSVYAGLDKKDLGRGEWRYLTREEIVHLKHFK